MRVTPPQEPAIQKMAQVRSDVEKGKLEPEKAVWLARKHLPWQEWLIVDFLRYWYLLGVMALEVFLALELVRDLHLKDLLGGLFVLAVLVAVAYPAYLLYRYFWPLGVLTKLDERPPLFGGRRKRRFEE